jgi:hypothetical protein
VEAALLVLGLALVVGTAVLVASCLRIGSSIGFLLAVYLVASLEIVAVSLALSVGHWLTRAGLLGALSVVLLVAFAAWLRLGRPPPRTYEAPIAAAREVLRDPVVAVMAGLAAVVQTYLLAVSLTVPQSLPDTMLYHLPRSALWRQQHAVAYVANMPELAVNSFPPNAEIATAATMILSDGDRYVGLVQLIALVFTCIAIVGIARRLRFDRRAAAFAALAFSTFTVVMLQTPTALNDLVVASFLIACAYFAIGTPRAELALAALALALALGTKLTTLFALPALAFFVFAAQPLRRWVALALYGVAGLAVGSFWLLVNVAETSRLDGGVATAEREGLGHRIGRSVVDFLEMSDQEGKGFLVSPLWGVPVALTAVVVALGLFWRRRWLAGALACVAGVFAFVSAPLLITWAHLGEYAWRHSRAAIGLGGTVPQQRLPDDFYESAMHSSYGLTFILLFLGSTVVVVAEVVRTRSSFVRLVALLAAPLTVLIGGIAISYGPQHLRYVVFSVALATSVFGIALRVRALAWAAAALAAVTTVVVLGYFVPRPAGLSALPGNRDRETARWFVQGGGGGGDGVAFRFLEERIPADAIVALALIHNTYIYPAWDAGLRRTVVFVSEDGSAPLTADWLVVGPDRAIDASLVRDEGWSLELESPRGWRIYGR